jgi:hypothetical protein
MEAELPSGFESMNRALDVDNAAGRCECCARETPIELFEFVEGEAGDAARR